MTDTPHQVAEVLSIATILGVELLSGNPILARAAARPEQRARRAVGRGSILAPGTSGRIQLDEDARDPPRPRRRRLRFLNLPHIFLAHRV